MTDLRTNQECITIEEMLDFSAVNKLDAKSIALITKINSHICKCAECRKQLKAFQTVEAAFSELYTSRSKEAETSLDADYPDF